MEDLENFARFVKSQADFHERQAHRFRGEERRHELHIGTAKTFNELHDYLRSQCEEKVAKGRIGNGLSLSWGELQDLPDELVKELSITESDKLDFSIAELIEKHGGMATLDRILVEVYRLTGEILKRSNLNARLYRMVQKGMIYSVPGRKGVYSSYEVSEEDVNKVN